MTSSRLGDTADKEKEAAKRKEEDQAYQDMREKAAARYAYIRELRGLDEDKKTDKSKKEFTGFKASGESEQLDLSGATAPLLETKLSGNKVLEDGNIYYDLVRGQCAAQYNKDGTVTPITRVTTGNYSNMMGHMMDLLQYNGSNTITLTISPKDLEQYTSDNWRKQHMNDVEGGLKALRKCIITSMDLAEKRGLGFQLEGHIKTFLVANPRDQVEILTREHEVNVNAVIARINIQEGEKGIFKNYVKEMAPPTGDEATKATIIYEKETEYTSQLGEGDKKVEEASQAVEAAKRKLEIAQEAVDKAKNELEQGIDDFGRIGTAATAEKAFKEIDETVKSATQALEQAKAQQEGKHREINVDKLDVLEKQLQALNKRVERLSTAQEKMSNHLGEMTKPMGQIDTSIKWATSPEWFEHLRDARDKHHACREEFHETARRELGDLKKKSDSLEKALFEVQKDLKGDPALLDKANKLVATQQTISEKLTKPSDGLVAKVEATAKQDQSWTAVAINNAKTTHLAKLPKEIIEVVERRRPK
ncbi:MAG TPA: hypothetical protein VJN02_12610 [Gammaproteobacteria bacterium]|nr:hypothetical protein [Gammaproteobacteria bacterium]